MKLTPIKEYQENSTVQGFFLCIEKSLRTTKAGNFYLDLILQDATGRIAGKVWDNVDHFRDQFESGDPVAAKGVVEKFGGQLQLSCTHIAKATPERYGRYGFREELLVPVISEDPKKLWDRLRKLITGVKNKHLKQLLREIFKTYKDTIMVLPASFVHHHPERGGLLTHMVSTGELALALAQHYPSINKDLLVAGVLLHDIGKVRSVAPGLEGDYTDAGHLAGHVVLGRDILRETIPKVADFPPQLALQLEHIIIAHSGAQKDGAPRPPKFPEALLAHHIDRLDGQLDLMFREIAHDTGDKPFTDARNHFRTPLWKKYRP